MRIELCAQVHIAGKLLLERGFIPELVMGSAVMLSGVFMPLLQFFPMLRADGDSSIAALPVAGDLIFFNPFVNEFDGLQGLLPKPAGLFQADLFFDFFHTAGVIADDLPAPDAPKPMRAASSTVTSRPFSARGRAVQSPVNPPPMTQVSVFRRPSSLG